MTGLLFLASFRFPRASFQFLLSRRRLLAAPTSLSFAPVVWAQERRTLMTTTTTNNNNNKNANHNENENDNNNNNNKEIHNNNNQQGHFVETTVDGMNDSNKQYHSGMLNYNDFIKSNYIDLYHLQDRPISSTQDEARRLLHEKFDTSSTNTNTNNNNDNDKTKKYVTVIADRQTNGRGTQGRKWESENKENEDNTNNTNKGTNLFLTVCIPFDEIPVIVTLLPLQIAVIIAHRINKVLQACQATNDDYPPNVTVKWPNDVLINGNKISGTLIENETVNNETWLIIGIGVNVAYTPNLHNSPGKQSRKACSIQDYCPNQLLPPNTASILGIDIASELVDWVVSNQQLRNYRTNFIVHELRIAAEEQIINEWKSYASFGQTYELRGHHVDVEHGGYQGEIVTVLDIQNDGQLVIKGHDGNQRLLIADYMF